MSEQFMINREEQKAIELLQQGVYAALENYSNVHRGSGHHSVVTTMLFDHAREIILDYLHLSKKRYIIVFCTHRRAQKIISQLDLESYQMVSSQETGLSLGLRVLAIRKNAMSRITHFEGGGGTARLVSRDWVIWAKAPDRFEAGTPAIINVIAFARALQLIRQSGIKSFQDTSFKKLEVSEILYHDELEKYSGNDLLDELRKTLIGRDVLVPTAEGTKPFINLDNGASTPTFTPVWNAATQALCQPLQVQQDIIREVKSICAKVLQASLVNFEVLFTSNTTEGINLVAESLSNESDDETEPVILNSLLEHNSNDLPWRTISGCSLVRLPVDDNGFIDLNDLERVLSSYNHESRYGKKRIRLVSLTGASNVLGVYNDLKAISQIVHGYGAKLLVDAAQMVAHRTIDLEGYDIDYLVFSGHKVYAPFGCGVLMVKKGLLSFSTTELELIRLSGEENVCGIAALGKALVLLQRIRMDLILKEEQVLTAMALKRLGRIPGLTIYGIKDPDSPEFDRKGGVIVFAIKGIMAGRIAKELTVRAGIGIRYGCHCSHMIIKHLLHVSPALERFQFLIVTLFPGVNLPGLARVSLGIENSEQDIDTFIRVLNEIARKSPFPEKHVKQMINDYIRTSMQKVFQPLLNEQHDDSPN
jgi:selenocysteine lyase/cysteine desulfurase